MSRTKAMGAYLRGDDIQSPFKRWLKDRRKAAAFQPKFEVPKGCSICGGKALRQVRGVGFCKDHYTEAVAAATKQIGLA